MADLYKLRSEVIWTLRDYGVPETTQGDTLIVGARGDSLTVDSDLRWESSAGETGTYDSIARAAREIVTWVHAKPEPIVITEPTMRHMSDERYFADPVPEGSLSQSGAKVLLSAGGPAKYQYRLTAEETTTDAMEFGKVAHRTILGEGRAYVAIDAPDRRSAAWKSQAAGARASGLVPLLKRDAVKVSEMAKAVLAHPTAGPLVVGEGEPELAAFTEQNEVWLRGKFDRLNPDCIVDYKTTVDASPEAFARSVVNYGYHLQAAMYRRLVADLAGEDLPMRFVVQEKEAPYLVGVYELDDAALALGEAELDRAIAIYAACKANSDWPGYDPGVVTLSLPAWAVRNVETDDQRAARLEADMTGFLELI